MTSSWDAVFNSSDGSESTPKIQDSWEAVFKPTQNDAPNETYDRLIDLRDDTLDSKKVKEVTPSPEPTPTEKTVRLISFVCCSISVTSYNRIPS